MRLLTLALEPCFYCLWIYHLQAVSYVCGFGVILRCLSSLILIPMALIAFNKFTSDLEKAGALGVRMPLEGGYEGRYRRRVRSAGYDCAYLSVRGLGDLSAYLLDVHGVRPPHLGKKNMEASAVGDRYYVPPIVSYRLQELSPKSKGLVLWLIEGHILSSQEIKFLVSLPSIEPKVKVVLEVGGDRTVTWFPLQEAVAA